MNTILTQQQVKELFDYNPETGVLRWKVKRGNARVGECKRRQVKINSRNYQTTHIIWIWMKGEQPSNWIDHHDGSEKNNRWNNLRLATRSQNNQNQRCRRDNLAGYKGILLKSTGYLARITIAGKLIRLGVFPTAEEAHAAYMKAAQESFGEFARGG